MADERGGKLNNQKYNNEVEKEKENNPMEDLDKILKKQLEKEKLEEKNKKEEAIKQSKTMKEKKMIILKN